MSSKRANAPEDISFEDGYDALKTIVARMGQDDVSVHEKFESFRRGKGLEQALRCYLSDRQGELTEIEEGKNLPEFRIVGASNRSGRAASGGNSREIDDEDFTPGPVAAASGSADDDVPL
jgi:exonuclease VII small subunit